MKSLPIRIEVAFALVAAVVLLGVAIALRFNPLGSVDHHVLNWMLDHRSTGVTSVATTVTDLFAPLWTGMWTVLAAAILVVLDRTLIRAITLLGTVALAGAVCELIKLAVDRLRPPKFDQVASPELAMSFPSGHVTGAAALLIGLAVIATTTARSRTRWWAVAMAVVAASVVAFTRLYLGAHWFSDVAAATVLATAAVIAAPLLVALGVRLLEPHTSVRGHRLLATNPTASTKG
ncbi:phosphatase PAP2 family protein [Williamsia maris]|uniref:Undecaprenyl-diphosphatase n=1 Tax=Williamsia maris TaxID=72806 RepID=A0ABT1H9S5_9NOCA|nr:phosphatase PAP2 family protein [Williamsia maris]MCP2175012.1 undecaprenyl-diphosphatase [Williamsia maris]